MGRKLRMADEKKRVIAIGEVMIEMARGSDGRYGTACGGDTFNTAVYLARAGFHFIELCFLALEVCYRLSALCAKRCSVERSQRLAF